MYSSPQAGATFDVAIARVLSRQKGEPEQAIARDRATPLPQC
ncbi:MAG: hypothetical protein AAFX40_05735 [Cyanobacteria bacterium J06639_1]